MPDRTLLDATAAMIISELRDPVRGDVPLINDDDAPIAEAAHAN
jgi:hypothetical protein